ncbi:hypothetical protein ABPG72_016232 [Tetrahymena utriculariae]
MNKEAQMKQQLISEKLPFNKHLLDDDKELAQFYIQVFQKCVEKISNKQLFYLEEFPQLNQIQVDKCYVLKLQSNDLSRLARKNEFLSIRKKYLSAGNFKYLVCNLTQNQKNLQCRIIKVSDEKKLEEEYENLRDFKFVHFYYKIDDKKNPKQCIKNTIKYYCNCAQQQESEGGQGECILQKSSTNKNQVKEQKRSIIEEKNIRQENNINLKKEKSSNLIEEDSESEESDECVYISNNDQITISNEKPNEAENKNELQVQHDLKNENQKVNQSTIIKNLLCMIKQRDMQILDQQQIILQQQMQQLQMQRQRLQLLEDINIYNPLQIEINSNFLKNNLNQQNAQAPIANKLDKNQIKKQDDDQTEIIELEDD